MLLYWYMSHGTYNVQMYCYMYLGVRVVYRTHVARYAVVHI